MYANPVPSPAPMDGSALVDEDLLRLKRKIRRMWKVLNVSIRLHSVQPAYPTHSPVLPPSTRMRRPLKCIPDSGFGGGRYAGSSQDKLAPSAKSMSLTNVFFSTSMSMSCLSFVVKAYSLPSGLHRPLETLAGSSKPSLTS